MMMSSMCCCCRSLHVSQASYFAAGRVLRMPDQQHTVGA